uniref:Uncharacterized protein n=1 Tax=Setaria italica TaxID=4555 RepID=K4A491_SETIT
MTAIVLLVCKYIHFLTIRLTRPLSCNHPSILQAS